MLSELAVLNRYMNDYCSQSHARSRNPQNLEEAVAIIDVLFSQQIFCYHDARDVQKVYEFLRTIPSPMGSESAQNRIIGIYNRIMNQQTVNNEAVIFTWHLKSIRVITEECFQEVLTSWRCLNNNIEDLAKKLPCCHSEHEFNRAIRELDLRSPAGFHFNLLGFPRNTDVYNILEKKLNNLRKNEAIKTKIPEKLRDLEHRRAQNPRINYPSYLEELINRGYLCLSDHIIAVKEAPDRDKIIKRDMTFADVSKVILEAREAIIQQVEEFIPTGSTNFLFLLGNTRAGKSTTLCFLKGDELILNEHHYEVVGDTQNVNHSEENSCTFLPVIEVINQEGLDDIVLIDFPGFHDTNGSLVSLGIELAIRALTKKYQPKVLVVDAISSGSALRSQKELRERLARLLTIHNHRVDCVVGLTKYSRDAESIDIKNINENLALRQEALGNPNITEQRRRDLNRQISAYRESLERLKRTIENRENAILARVLRNETSAHPNDRSRLIKLDDLDRQERREEVLRSIWEAAPQVRFEEGNHFLKLDENDRALLDTHLFRISVESSPQDKPRFLQQLSEGGCYHNPILERLQDRIKFQEFERAALEYSLVKAITDDKDPQIGQFLHLTNIDPKIVKYLDSEFAQNCLHVYIKSIVLSIGGNLLNPLEGERALGVSSGDINNLTQAANRLKDRLRGLEGLDNFQQVMDRWTQFRVIEDGFWTRFFLPIREFFAGRDPTRVNNQEIIRERTRQINDLHGILMRLIDIKHLASKREYIESAFNTNVVSTVNQDTFRESLRRKISAIRTSYGENSTWDSRVDFFSSSQALLTNFSRDNREHLSLVYGHAYRLMEGLETYSIVLENPEIETTLEQISQRADALFTQLEEGVKREIQQEADRKQRILDNEIATLRTNRRNAQARRGAERGARTEAQSGAFMGLVVGGLLLGPLGAIIGAGLGAAGGAAVGAATGAGVDALAEHLQISAEELRLRRKGKANIARAKAERAKQWLPRTERSRTSTLEQYIFASQQQSAGWDMLADGPICRLIIGQNPTQDFLHLTRDEIRLKVVDRFMERTTDPNSKPLDILVSGCLPELNIDIEYNNSLVRTLRAAALLKAHGLN